jgi:proline iminopeptidase
MKLFVIVGVAATALGAAAPLPDASAQQGSSVAQVTETRIPVDGGASLYARTLGRGQPMIVLHGGPDFDHAYLLPDLDRWRDAFHLIYYDQRGRGRSADGVRPEDVSLASDVADIEKVRQHFGFGSPAVLGHSWGAVLALEYALRHPAHVSHLVLMNPAPVATSDVAVLRKYYLERIGAQMDRQREIIASPAYQAGDPETNYARYRIHFRPALKRTEDYEKLMASMRAAFLRQGNDGIVKARAVEDRLMQDTWEKPDYDLLPRLRTLKVPTLVIWGDADFIPLEISEHIARAIPNAQLNAIEGCGHFAYMECGEEARSRVDDFFQSTKDQSPASQR